VKKQVFLIAEIGQAHDGSLGILHSYIDAVASTGVNAIKFQTHIAEAESSEFEPFRVKFSYEDNTRYDYWNRMSFTLDQWVGIKEHCEKAGLEFMSSPFSNCAVDLLEKLNIKRYKIGSGEVSNFLMLERIAKTGKEIILSSGMSSFDELDKTVAFINKHKINYSILQCTTSYPTKAENVGLNVIPELRKRYNVPVGLSDHSGEIYPSLGAVALGADILEFHAVFDKRMFGPDATSSLEIDQIKELVKGVRFLEASLSNPVDKSDSSKFTELKAMFGKSLSVNKDLRKGAAIQIEDLESKKPSGYGIPASMYEQVIGKKLSKDLSKYSFLKEEDIQ
jgi:N-acetylneuraminate synthase